MVKELKLRTKRNDLTAVLVVHNEERLIGRALNSICKVTDKIIVVHDGECKDKTIDICKRYGCDVYVRKETGDAELHRPWTYETVKTKWILQVDADEYLSNGLVHSLDSLLDDKKVSCWEILWPFFDGKKYRSNNWPYKRALFRKNKIMFVALPHEEVVVNGVVKKTKFRLNHKPNYDNYTLKSFLNKHRKWIEIHAKLLLADPNNYGRYPKKNDLRPHYYFIIKNPLLISVPLFLYHFSACLFLGGIKEGVYGLKSSFFQSLYYLVLCLKVYQLKLKTTN